MAPRESVAQLRQRIRGLERALRDSQHSCLTLLDAVNEKSEQLGIVNGLLSSLGQAMDLRSILQVFAVNLNRICPYDRISIALFDPDTQRFRIPFMVKGGRVLGNAEGPIAYGDTILSQVVTTRSPILRQNVKKTMHFKSDTAFVKKGYSCELLFPLTLGDRVLGTFNVGCFEPETLTHRHQQILADVIPCVTIALDRYLGSMDDAS